MVKQNIFKWRVYLELQIKCVKEGEAMLSNCYVNEVKFQSKACDGCIEMTNVLKI